MCVKNLLSAVCLFHTAHCFAAWGSIMLWTLRVTDTTTATSVCSQALMRCRHGFTDCSQHFSSSFSNLFAQLLSSLLSTWQKTVIRFHIFNAQHCYVQLHVHVGPIFCTVITDSQVTIRGLFNNTQTMLGKCMAVQSDGSEFPTMFLCRLTPSYLPFALI